MNNGMIFGPVLLDAAQAELIHQILIDIGNLEMADLILSKGRLRGDENSYASIAREVIDDTMEIDEHPLVSIADDGAHVMIWKWISTSEL